MLSSLYRYYRRQITDTLIPFLDADGLIVQELQQVLQALERMADNNVDFVDAYLAEIARHAGGTIASFDRDFRRLDIPWLEPE